MKCSIHMKRPVVKFFYILAPILCVVILSYCASFSTKEDKDIIKTYEGEYFLLSEAVRGDHTIQKGQRVRVRIMMTDDFIKVYAMSTLQEIVKGEWILILYLFPDDFENEKFSKTAFEEKLYRIVAPAQ